MYLEQIETRQLVRYLWSLFAIPPYWLMTYHCTLEGWNMTDILETSRKKSIKLPKFYFKAMISYCEGAGRDQ